MIRRLKKIDYERYFVFVILLALVPGSFGYMSWEAENVSITTLYIDGAPEGIVYISRTGISISSVNRSIRSTA